MEEQIITFVYEWRYVIESDKEYYQHIVTGEKVSVEEFESKYLIG